MVKDYLIKKYHPVKVDEGCIISSCGSGRVD